MSEVPSPDQYSDFTANSDTKSGEKGVTGRLNKTIKECIYSTAA